MNRFKKVLKEVNFTLGNIVVFESMLNAVIIFLGFFLILIVVKFYPFLALIPAVIYAIIMSLVGIKKVKKKRAVIVEKKHSPLNERLRTAVDNINMENPIVEALQDEVVSEMRNVKISNFVNKKFTSYRILVAVILCFMIIFVASKDFAVDFKELGAKGRELMSAAYIIGGNEIGEAIGEILAATGGTSMDDIYGEESVANIGNEVLDVQIKPISYEINVRNVKDVEEREFEETLFEETCIDADACSPQESYRNDYPKDQQELVKNYFLKIAK
jgi:hypothetical protein